MAARRHEPGASGAADGGPRRRRRPPLRGRRRRRRRPLLRSFCGCCGAAAVAASALLVGQTVLADDLDLEEFTPRSFDGVGNNEAFPSWGAVGATQLRSVAGAYYADADFTPPGDLTRPTAREVMTDVFLESPPALSTMSALFIGWGQLLAFDLSLTSDNSSEPLDIECNDGTGAGGVDVWCPLGAESDPIPFYRSDAALSDDDGALGEETRSPVNYATAFVDLDFVYGRSEDEAAALRSSADGDGFMALTENGLPYVNDDGTWLIADQRSAQFPVTFALHVMLLLEHNRCCMDIAPSEGFEGDEDIYQACRGWTIAVFQHVTENDFLIRLLGGNIQDLGESMSSSSSLSSLSSSSSSTTTTTEATTAPTEATTAPTEATTAPTEATTAPTEATTAPTEATTPPAEATTAPVEATTAPVEATTPPAEATTPPGDSGDGSAGGRGEERRRIRRRGLQEMRGEPPDEDGREHPVPGRQSRRGLWLTTDYDENTNPGADTFTLTAGVAAFESALPSTVRVVGEGYESTRYDNIELAAAVGADGLVSFFNNVKVVDVLRGAVLSPVYAADTHYTAAVSNGSPLFKLPVDSVQRGRDHGLPTYNDARAAFGLSEATTFTDVTTSSSSTSSSTTTTSTTSSSGSDADEEVADILSTAYGGNVSTLDAVTGALAEPTMASSGGVFGELLHAAWLEQMYRAFQGDRFHHLHSRDIEDASLTTISDLINRTTGAADIPLSAFVAAAVEVCGADCSSIGVSEADLSDSYSVAWEVVEDNTMTMSLSAKGIGDTGMLGIGWGGLTMSDAQDYVICEVLSSTEAECIDRQATGGRSLPDPDDEDDPYLEVLSVEVEGDWTTVQFLRSFATLDDQDYDLSQDLDNEEDTEVIYSFREGAGVGQHPNANRGASTVNFATGDVENECDENNFVSIHGALMLIAWMVLAPWGIYYVRYRKGEEIDFIWRYQWWEMHEEIMIVASEAVLPLGITAIFASGGEHQNEHAHWGYYMIAAVIAQVLSGWLRVKGLGGKNANFCLFHRCNKFFHIYAGRFAYLAGVVQCYRGLELVASDDQLIFSAGDGLDLQLGSFGFVYDYGFPAWFGLIALIFLYLETRKQYRRYFKKGSATVLGCLQVVNEGYKGDEGADGEQPKRERLMPRTEDLPIYSVAEFNDKVLNGQSWVLVDGAILDVSEFAQRHPGGRRLIINALGTDITQELLGEDLSVGHAMSFSPHAHSERAWTILRRLVVGYIEEEEDDNGGGDRGGGQEQHQRARVGSGARDSTAERTARDGSVSSEVRRPSSVGASVATTVRAGDAEVAPAAEGQGAKRKNHKFRVAGQAVMLVAGRGGGGGLTGDALASKAQRLNPIASIPDKVVTPPVNARDHLGSDHVAPRVVDGPRSRAPPKRSNSSNKRLLERFHVCPLLFRERMGATSAVGRGNLPTTRPVYRYIFLCPGQAQVLPQNITGVCYFNMRAQEKGNGVIQRSYNAYAVRVRDTNPTPTAGGMLMGGLSHGSDKGAGTLIVVPASQTTEGVLCIEMRIRLYHDGAMSKLLERLAKDTDNPAVQLQGPFVIQKLVPPPAHRNVVMIAAGTGINPMVQQIRDYLALPRVAAQSSRSRLALVWQATSEADLYGSEEMTELQAKSNGLLEVTVLISGEHRKRNIPGAAFRKGAGKLLAKAGLVSPAAASPANSFRTMPSGRPSNKNSVSSIKSINETSSAVFPEDSEKEGRGVEISTGTSILSTVRRHLRTSERIPSNTSVAGALARGKVSREVLEEVFGPSLLGVVEAARKKEEQLSATVRRRLQSLARRNKAGTARRRSSSGGGERKEPEKKYEDEDDDDDVFADFLADDLAGSGDTPGKLQVVVSGPSGFVFYVETILTEMGVLPSAIVLLD